MRLYPALGTMFPTYVPRGGAMIAGRWFKGGVGIKSIVEHRDKGFFGEDADQVVPEWWTETDPKMAANMERHLSASGKALGCALGSRFRWHEM
jgi:hypothetical protein